jgi:hypothetical protein
MKILFFVVAIVFSNIALANTYMQINGLSLHDQSGYNGFNYGIGIERDVSQSWSIASGWYRNSEYRGSAYTYGRYSFYKQHHWNLGLSIGAVTGYQRAQVVPMAFPEVCYSWLCAVAFPKVEATGANVLGLRLRVPVN